MIKLKRDELESIFGKHPLLSKYKGLNKKFLFHFLDEKGLIANNNGSWFANYTDDIFYIRTPSKVKEYFESRKKDSSQKFDEGEKSDFKVLHINMVLKVLSLFQILENIRHFDISPEIEVTFKDFNDLKNLSEEPIKVFDEVINEHVVDFEKEKITFEEFIEKTIEENPDFKKAL